MDNKFGASKVVAPLCGLRPALVGSEYAFDYILMHMGFMGSRELSSVMCR
jgi:hypothetical protein